MEELGGTEIRNRSREAASGVQSELDAVWEPTDGGAATIQVVSAQVMRAAAGTSDTLAISHGQAFRETLILTPPVYRLLAGGHPDEGERTGALAQRFTINPGGAGSDAVSTAREALASLVAVERPQEMARARRLVALEHNQPKTLRLPLHKRIALFEQRWSAEAINARIDAAVSIVASRTILLMTGRDQVALWVRKDLAEDCRLLTPALSTAVLNAPARQVGFDPLITLMQVENDGSPFSRSHGRGQERELLVDLTRFRKAVAAMEAEADRNAALLALEDIAARSGMIARQRQVRRQDQYNSRTRRHDQLRQDLSSSAAS